MLGALVLWHRGAARTRRGQRQAGMQSLQPFPPIRTLMSRQQLEDAAYSRVGEERHFCQTFQETLSETRPEVCVLLISDPINVTSESNCTVTRKQDAMFRQ